MYVRICAYSHRVLMRCKGVMDAHMGLRGIWPQLDIVLGVEASAP